jgi:SEC-C motif-containing protein
MKTTHPDNPDYTTDSAGWRESILEFCRTTPFTRLKITEFTDGESEAFVTFEAMLGDYTMKERSRFLKVEGKWLYESGTFS